MIGCQQFIIKAGRNHFKLFIQNLQIVLCAFYGRSGPGVDLHLRYEKVDN